MLTIEIELLAGRYVAQQANDRSQVEWPPHPARFFSALVAASGHVSRRDATTREALLSLENLPAPVITASNLDTSHGARTVNTVFVPVNDTSLVGNEYGKQFEKVATATGKKQVQAVTALKESLSLRGAPSATDVENALGLLPAGRPRKERTFPSFSPDVTRLWFSWPDATLSPGARQGLERLLDGVTALGHSSSLVRCALVDAAGEGPYLKRFVPRHAGGNVLRWVAAGQLERLDAEFERHQGEKSRVLPSRPVAYGLEEPAQQKLGRSIFEHDGWMVLACSSERHQGRFQQTRCVDIAKALHGALASNAKQPAHELITGRVDGKPTARPHIAILPLPDVGHAHAHGGVMGVAIVFPRDASEEGRIEVIDALAGFVASGRPLTLPRGALLRVEQPSGDVVALRERTWATPARRWASVTPIALDRNPGDLNAPEGLARAAALVADACEHVGLPRPQGVEVSLSPYLPGSRPVREFDVFPREPGRLRRLRVHAFLDFGEDVLGPVVLGAGRFFGLGLFRPITGGQS